MSESLTFSSLLSKFAPSDNATSGSNSSGPTSSVGNKPSFSRLTAVGSSRPSSATGGPASRFGSSPNPVRPTSNGSSPRVKAENGAAPKKRKLDAPTEPLTETERQREERKRKLLETLKAKQSASKGMSTTAKPTPQTQKVASKPTARPSAPEPKPAALSYKERLALAAKLAEEKRNSNTIVHKARAPVVEKKEWQKRLEAKHQPKASGAAVIDRKSRSPGTGISTATKGVSKDTAKSTLARKKSGETKTAVKGKALDKSKPAEPVKRRRSPSPISWRGRNAPPPTKKPQRSKFGRRAYDDEDDEDDSWIVDDDEDEEASVGRAYSKKYRYAESYEESDDSDMEARGADILEEEERSRITAVREDREQEALEKEMAARKAAVRKKSGKY